MKIETKEIYSELYQIVNWLGAEYRNKLPNSLLNMLEEKREIHYNPQYTDDIPLHEQNVRKETIAIIALLHLNYWCENEKEKLEIKQILKNNEDRYQEKIRNQYNPNDIFKKHKEDKDIAENVMQNEVAMVAYKESMLKKFINKIKSVFHIN